MSASASHKSTAPVREAGANGTVSLRADNPQARHHCLLLLRYCLSDLGAVASGRARGSGRKKIGAAASGNYQELAGLPFVPLADGSHGTFRSLSAVDSAKLEKLRGMGFSEGRSRQALVKFGEVQPSIEWLFSGGGQDGVEEQPFVLCAQEEADLLASAGSRMISEASFSKGGSVSGNTSEAARPGAKEDATDHGEHDDGRILRALRSPSLQAVLNITYMRDELLPDLVGQTLPVAWRGGSGGSGFNSATAFPWTPSQDGHPDVEWFRRLWRYLAATRPSAVQLLAESYPIIPTGENVVCPLSLRSAVIDGSRLGPQVCTMLVKAGCRTLLPGVFSGGIDRPRIAAEDKSKGGKSSGVSEAKQKNSLTSGRSLPPPPPELFEYVRPGTRAGLLAALGTAKRTAGKPFHVLMSTAAPVERDALRSFLAREPASEMSVDDISVCKELPILPLHADGHRAAHILDKVARAKSMGRDPPPKPIVPTRSYAAADDGPTFLLLEAGNGLVGVGQSGTRAEELSVDASAEPEWLETHLFTQMFLKLGGASAGREGAAEAALAERLGAKLIGRAIFFVDHVFPAIELLPAGLRNAAMVEALLEAPRLSQQHPEFKTVLGGLPFVPAGSGVSCVSQMSESSLPRPPPVG